MLLMLNSIFFIIDDQSVKVDYKLMLGSVSRRDC